MVDWPGIATQVLAERCSVGDEDKKKKRDVGANSANAGPILVSIVTHTNVVHGRAADTTERRIPAVATTFFEDFQPPTPSNLTI